MWFWVVGFAILEFETCRSRFVSWDKIQGLCILYSDSCKPLLLIMLPFRHMIWQQFAMKCYKSHQKIAVFARRGLGVCMQLHKGFLNADHHISCITVICVHSRLRLQLPNEKDRRTWEHIQRLCRTAPERWHDLLRPSEESRSGSAHHHHSPVQHIIIIINNN